MTEQFIAQNLVKKFDKRIIVDNVSFSVNCGKIVGLLGPNGAGKTTTFYMMVGFLRPNSGNVLLNDKIISKYPIHKRAKIGIGYLPQNASIFRHLSVEDNLLAVMEVWGIPRSERQKLLTKIIEQFSLKLVKKSPAIALSGGERRRLEIARILIIKPKFLLLDEPFAGIDPVTVDEIQKLIKNLVKYENLGVLITDHNVRETLAMCDNAYILASGKILAHGTPAEITQNDDVKKAYLGENFIM